MRILSLATLLLVLLIYPCAAAPNAPTVLSGWVRVASEDKSGKVLSVEIVVGEAPQEEPYLVTGGGAGPELLKLIGEWVVASGVVTEDPLGWKSIEITRFTKLDDLPGDDEPPRTEPKK